MLNFDTRGNLIPYECIQSSVEELMEHFVNNINSETRKINFENYLRYSTDLKKLSGGFDLKQWVDGSFVTKKTNPKDIDIVTFIGSMQLKIIDNHIHHFKGDQCRLLYGVDAYIVEVYDQSSKFYSFTTGNTAYWYEQFVSNKSNTAEKKFKKGFLEIIY